MDWFLSCQANSVDTWESARRLPHHMLPYKGFWPSLASGISTHLHVRASKLGSVQGVRSVEVTDAALIRWLRTAPYEEV